jgi:peptide/nickel transport system permease protein
MSIEEELSSTEEFSRWQLFIFHLKSRSKNLAENWRIYARSPIAVAGLLLLVIFALMSISHPILMKYVWQKNIFDPVVGYDMAIFPHPSPPSEHHLLGTDTLGRDVLSILLAAAGPTFLMAMVAALATAIFSTISASLSAYFGGLVDSLFTLISNTVLLLPAPILMVVVGFTLKPSPLFFGLIFGVVNGLGGGAIVLRAHALTVIPKTFMDAARLSGAESPYIIITHLIPHMLPLVAVNMMITVTGAIFADGFIAFMGVSRASLNWGSMIYDSFTYQAVSSTIPWNVMIPAALSISLFAASFYMVSQGLYLVAEPRAREILNGAFKK